MARIPDEEIAQLKESVSLERLVGSYGVQLTRRGGDLHGLCPFHDDREPSLVVSPQKNLWHCLGACQVGGSVIDWVMKAEGVSFRHAVELLRDDAALGGGPRRAKQSTVRKLDAPFEQSAEDSELLGQVVDYYTAALKQSPEALSYLAQRGLKHPEVIDHFRLGFANRTLGYRLPNKQRKAGAELRGRLEQLGIFRSSGHEHFNGSVVVPVLDAAGQVVEIYGRKINEGLRKGTVRHLYLPGPHRGIWNLQAVQQSEELILCESLIDALTFWCAGYRHVTAAYGTEGLTDEHRSALTGHRVKRLVIAYDRDAAGDKAADKLADELGNQGLSCFRVQFPRGMDANAYALKLQPAERSLGLVLRQAAWMGKGPAPGQPIAAPIAEAAPNVADEAPTADPPPLPSLAAEPPGPQVAGATRRAEAPAVPPAPAAVSASIPTVEVKGEQVELSLGDRRWRIRGLGKNLSVDQLRVNVLVSRRQRRDDVLGAPSFFVDTLDLYSAKQRGAYVRQAADELELEPRVIKRDLGQLLLALEAHQEAQIEAALADKDSRPELTKAERDEALSLLEDPELLARIVEDFERCGIVGEEQNKLVGYLAAVSRMLDEPLAIVIQSSSAAGKSSLMEAVLSLFPSEEQVKYSAMTGQALFYMGEMDLAHKILAIVEEEGAERASYALKLLQSEGELSIASTGKDPVTGRLVTQQYRVEGPVMIFLTTTAAELDEELLNRCLVLTVDEARAQTRAIHRMQRSQQTLAGQLARRDRQAVIARHQNAQRLLRPLMVVNPFAEQLSFVDSRTRARRDHMKYLTLIRSVALLHQYQRPVKKVCHGSQSVEYIEVTRDDIVQANRLMAPVLGRSLDELAPQTRRLLELLDAMVSGACAEHGLDRADFHFTRRQVREHSGWSYDQVRVHLDRLVELEYVLVHRGGRGQQMIYELLYDGQGQDGQPFFIGLVDVDGLDDPSTTRGLGGGEADFGGTLGPHLAPIGPTLGSDATKDNGNGHRDLSSPLADEPKIASQEAPARSYRLARRSCMEPRAVPTRDPGAEGDLERPLARGPQLPSPVSEVH